MKYYSIQQCIFHGSNCSCEYCKTVNFAVPELKDVQMFRISRRILKLLLIDEATILRHRSVCSTPPTEADRPGMMVTSKINIARKQLMKRFGVPYILSA
jgi:hypothetical protein